MLDYHLPRSGWIPWVFKENVGGSAIVGRAFFERKFYLETHSHKGCNDKKGY